MTINHAIVITVLLLFGLHTVQAAEKTGKIRITYERPMQVKYVELFQTLRAHRRALLQASADEISRLYHFPKAIHVVVTTCGYVNSRYEPDEQLVVLCYESLYQKVYDYPQPAVSKAKFVNRVFQNIQFTFWHEIGHALMHQYEIARDRPPLVQENLADEFAVLSMIWHQGTRWKDAVVISALHFRNKPEDKSYETHADDRLRYERMIALLFGFAPKSYSRFADEVSQMIWLDRPAMTYYLERSRFWEQHLRDHTLRDYFNN